MKIMSPSDIIGKSDTEYVSNVFTFSDQAELLASRISDISELSSQTGIPESELLLYLNPDGYGTDETTLMKISESLGIQWTLRLLSPSGKAKLQKHSAERLFAAS